MRGNESCVMDERMRFVVAHAEGLHPAGLDLLDCFASALAKECGFPLLFIGNDFARTDIVSALA